MSAELRIVVFARETGGYILSYYDFHQNVNLPGN